MAELKQNQVVRIGGINLRIGETCTLIEPSVRIPGRWYVRLRNGGIALYMDSDLEPLESTTND